MICIPAAITVAYLIEPGFTYVLPPLLDQTPLTPPFMDWFPLFVAAVATLIALAANWIVQACFITIRFPEATNPHPGVNDET